MSAHLALLAPAHTQFKPIPLFSLSFYNIRLCVGLSLIFSSLSLRASRECQNKEKLLEQRFRSSLHDYRQWLVNANISTAKCFDSPHSIQDASAALQRIQVGGEISLSGGLLMLPGQDS